MRQVFREPDFSSDAKNVIMIAGMDTFPKGVRRMKKLVIGMLAHVDAGKTTLSEALLYESGKIRKMGRVDNGDAYLDTDAMEKERGITIFSKQASFSYKDAEITLLDTPGHVDFSAEMERTLQVLDYAVLVISGADGVQGHTKTLWRLLERYEVPVFLFINKMDQQGCDKEKLLREIKEKLSDGCIDFTDDTSEDFLENVAVNDEYVLEHFLQTGEVETECIKDMVESRIIFPCFFGAALYRDGVAALLNGIYKYMKEPEYADVFGARVFKIARDGQGNRLTFFKVTGGSLKVRDSLHGLDEAGGEWEEKVNQLRLYSGDKYETCGEVDAGSICAALGLGHTYPGQGLGAEPAAEVPILEPVLTYRVILPPEIDASAMLPKLRLLEEEDPQLHIVWDETLQEIQVRIMGEVQLEILQRMVKERFGVVIEFGQGNVVYKETIAAPVIGVGHFEPLRHYAEVQLLLEPVENGSGLHFAANCSEDVLAKNWQRLVLTHLEEKEHKGVLLGAPITDIKITLLAGKAHLKHTEGGDFRQATYRAVRQGLMESSPVLLEPYYSYTLEIPEKSVGRAMTDLERLGGKFEMPEMLEGTAVLTGYAPVVCLRDYQKEVTAYTGGQGHLSCTLKGYFPCHNTGEVLEQKGYDPENDLENPSGSVFCAHGAGYVVPWDEVKALAHTECTEYVTGMEYTKSQADKQQEAYIPRPAKVSAGEMRDMAMGTEEIDLILAQATHANKRSESEQRKGIYGRKKERVKPVAAATYEFKPVPKKEEYLLVDGYNVIFAWEELADVAKVSIDGARGKLLDILCDYQAMCGCQVIVVFDAYRVQGHATEISDYYNIHVVFTKEAETADQYIEKFAHQNSKKYRITVATSDGLEQIIIRGEGCALLSARELAEEIGRAKKNFRETFLEGPKEKGSKYYLMDDFK